MTRPHLVEAGTTGHPAREVHFARCNCGWSTSQSAWDIGAWSIVWADAELHLLGQGTDAAGIYPSNSTALALARFGLARDAFGRELLAALPKWMQRLLRQLWVY